MNNYERQEIKFRGYINQQKRENNTRILCLNANGMRYRNNQKIVQLVEFCKQYKLDITIITETNIKQTIKSTNIMKSKFKELGRNLEIIIADSKVCETIDSDQL